MDRARSGVRPRADPARSAPLYKALLPWCALLLRVGMCMHAPIQPQLTVSYSVHPRSSSGKEGAAQTMVPWCGAVRTPAAV